jgi:uncharacterized protein
VPFEDMDKNVKLFMQKLREIPDFHSVKFVILYGSRAAGNANRMSDYDFAIYFEGNKDERYGFLKKAAIDKKFDVKIFQDLPLYIKKDVLKGNVIYAEDEGFVYDTAYRIIKDFERFKKYYYDYISRRPAIK